MAHQRCGHYPEFTIVSKCSPYSLSELLLPGQHAIALVLLTLCCLISAGQESTRPAKALSVPYHYVVGVKASTLGLGIDAGAQVTDRSRVRAGFNFFSYSQDFHENGAIGTGHLTLRSVQLQYDWAPFRGTFYVSPGLLVYNGNRVRVNGSSPGGQIFTINRRNFLSDPANPVNGTGKLDFNHVAPSVLAGFSSVLPGRDRRFTMPIEFGFAFGGAPETVLSIIGGVCNVDGSNCRNAATDPVFQGNVQAVQDRLNRNLRFLRFYPVVSIGFAYRF